MAHEIDESNGRNNIAYVGTTPWHGLGQKLTPDAPLEVWMKEAGLEWTAERSPVTFIPNGGDGNSAIIVKDRDVLYRSDTHATLGIVSKMYRVVQPADVIEFYRSLVEGMGYRLETAGSLKGGTKVWGLARTADAAKIGGEDPVNGYLLLATSYDGTLSTAVSRTTVRVVCRNTLNMAIGHGGHRADIRIPHSTTFRPDIIKGQLGLETNEAWERWVKDAETLARRKVSKDQAVDFFMDLFYGKKDVDVTSAAVQNVIEGILNIYHNGVGQQLGTAQNTAWGLVNTVTRYIDHERKSKSQDNRLNAAWFGNGAAIKDRAWRRAMALVA